MMRAISMRRAFSMIELIFAIVIIAISVLSIPSMMAVANNASKISMSDDDVLSRLMGWTIDKSQARWDASYAASASPILWITTTDDLNCSRGSGNVWYRINSDSTVQCHELNLSASVIPSPGDGNLSRGIEQLNGGTETISVAAATGETYDINATYGVQYVNSGIAINGNTATATWRLGSSNNLAPDDSETNTTHLKRIVTRFYNPASQTDTVLTFFKSNKGN